MTETAPPPWKFWHPLSFWKVILIFFLAEVVCVFPALVLREGLGIPVPMWVAFGLAGGLGAVASSYIARRQLLRDAKPD